MLVWKAMLSITPMMLAILLALDEISPWSPTTPGHGLAATRRHLGRVPCQIGCAAGGVGVASHVGGDFLQRRAGCSRLLACSSSPLAQVEAAAGNLR